VSIAGKPLRLRSATTAQARRLRFISEDRAGEGVFLRLSVAQNLVATRISQHSSFGILRRRRLRAAAVRLAAVVGIDQARLPSPADELSGGNQQKLAFGRAISDAPGVLLMNEPTRGVDVGARADIYRLIRQFCAEGYCVIMASSDLEEVLGIADVILTMYRGRQVASYRGGEADMQRVLADITHLAAAA
jgi:ABC-type sugar transport system ATPase subunit